MMELIKRLSKRPRVAGTEDGKEACKLIENIFNNFGYDTEIQTVDFTGWKLIEKPKLKINNKPVKCLPVIWSGSGKVKGRIVNAGRIKTFEAYQWLRYRIVDNGKTKGYVITRPDIIWLQLVDKKSKLPYFMVYPDTCKMLKEEKNLTAEGSVKSRFIMNQKIRNVITKNNSKKKILVCAHYDSILDSPGANDNASGVVALIELARINTNPNVQFIAFDAEEWNKYGAYSYVRSLNKNELKKIKLVINIDMIGSKKGKDYIICSKKLNKLVTKSLKKINVRMKLINGIGPPFDYWPFYKKGIPIVCFNRSYDYCHDKRDTVDKVSPEPMRKVIKVANQIINEIV